MCGLLGVRLEKIKSERGMFSKTVHVHILYCNYNKNLNCLRTAKKKSKPRSVLGWFPQLKNHVVRKKRMRF